MMSITNFICLWDLDIDSVLAYRGGSFEADWKSSRCIHFPLILLDDGIYSRFDVLHSDSSRSTDIIPKAA